ncbi:hypothetical protein HPB50_023861 [Hyalomma asiaticum]|uniref:Uncharacterized protein n=1 Tax=Hyalomma asiaticum TaxID=266040 RepID=A0ACB7T1K4_HYAAI|nr:hypothetical protein HPB50_023861 [Hyalomma asiaticum]
MPLGIRTPSRVCHLERLLGATTSDVESKLLGEFFLQAVDKRSHGYRVECPETAVPEQAGKLTRGRGRQ